MKTRSHKARWIFEYCQYVYYRIGKSRL